MPGISAMSRTSFGTSRRISGSPPVRRILSIPKGAATRTKCAISSKVSSSARSRNVTSSGMQ
jgi:hypothetical protein